MNKDGKKVWENIISEISTRDEKIYKKDLFKTENFNVVLVHLEKDGEILPHPESYAVFFYVLEGSGIFTRSQEEYPLKKGSSIYYKKNEIRGIKSKKRLILLGIQEPH